MHSNKPSKKLVIGATILGNVLEWYEFSLYAFLAPVIAALFFPPSDSSIVSVLKFLMIFAVGFISRPIGGVLFGSLGDRKGRRVSLLLSIVMISLPTFAVGLLPTYNQVGYLSPVLLIALRLLQGIPVGGEFPGTICYLIESCEEKQKTFFSSFAFFGSQIGILLNILECLAMEIFLTKQQQQAWGWRLSFLVGGVIGLTGFYLRYKLRETPLFRALEEKHHLPKAPIHQVFSHYKFRMFIAMLLGALPLGGFYQMFVFTSIHLEQFFSLTTRQGLYVSGFFVALSTACLPIIGRFFTRYRIKGPLLFSSALIALLSFPLFAALIKHNFYATLIIATIFVVVLSISFALISQVMAGLFPTEVRFSGLAMSYNVSNIVFASALPIIAMYLGKSESYLYMPALLMAAMALTTVITLIPLKEHRGQLFL